MNTDCTTFDKHDHSDDSLPWQPVSPGFSIKLLRGGDDEDTRALLLRIEPGTVIARHRHGGEVHAVNLAGQRKLLETGEVVGPGGYVYEPPGNVDSWMAVGDEPVIVFVTVRGVMETLGEGDVVTASSTTRSLTESYRRFVVQCGTAEGEPLDTDVAELHRSRIGAPPQVRTYTR